MTKTAKLKTESEKEDYIQEARERIEQELEYVDIKPYSHNIISLRLSMVADKCGKKEANNLIDEFELNKLGWHKVK